jgi:hypothetical protein
MIFFSQFADKPATVELRKVANFECDYDNQKEKKLSLAYQQTERRKSFVVRLLKRSV